MTEPVLVRYLRDHIADHGYAPSVREMCVAFGVKSPSTMQARLRTLFDEGWIERKGPRAIEIRRRDDS